MGDPLSRGLAAAFCAFLLGGCASPRCTTLGEIFPSGGRSASMSVGEASATIRRMLRNTPAGPRPDYPGDRAMGTCITSVRLLRHDRSGLVLVEAKAGRRVVMEFCVRTRAEGEMFAEAVWRLRREYRGR